MTSTYVIHLYPPEKSDLHKQPDIDYFKTLREEIAQFSTLGEIIIVGNLNSRTSDSRENYDTIEEDPVFGDTSSITSNTTHDDIEQMLDEYGKRSNGDIIVNTFGRHLISLVQQSHLSIINGRKIGDFKCKITHVNPNDTSTVDYCIISLSLFSFILRFNVLDQQWYSYHNPYHSP